jgi:hypothetical protein
MMGWMLVNRCKMLIRYSKTSRCSIHSDIEREMYTNNSFLNTEVTTDCSKLDAFFWHKQGVQKRNNHIDGSQSEVLTLMFARGVILGVTIPQCMRQCRFWGGTYLPYALKHRYIRLQSKNWSYSWQLVTQLYPKFGKWFPRHHKTKHKIVWNINISRVCQDLSVGLQSVDGPPPERDRVRTQNALFGNITTDYCDNHRKLISAFCCLNAEFLHKFSWNTDLLCILTGKCHTATCVF